MCLVLRNLRNSNLPIVTEIFIRCRKLNVSLVFITQSYFAVSQTKFYTLFYYEKSKQTRASANHIWALYEYFQNKLLQKKILFQ